MRSSVTATGGGGTLESPLTLVREINYTVTVGGGGVGGTGLNGVGTQGSNSVFATITSIGGGINMDFSSLYPSTMTYHFGGNKSRRILKGKKILKNIKENDTKRES